MLTQTTAGPPSTSSFKGAYGLLFAALLGYVGYRAYALSFTHDESVSFSIFVFHIKEFRDTANHHYLNTWLMQWCYQVLGGAEWALRLPNVLAFGGCAWVLGRRMVQQQQPWLVLGAGMGLLLLNPFVLDFFSLARGYGLSLCFSTCSLLALSKPLPQEWDREALDRGRQVQWGKAMVWATLATWANLAAINLLLAVVAIGVLQHLFWEQRRALWWYGLVLLGIGLAVVPPMQRLMVLKGANQLYHGVPTLLQAFDSMVIYTLYDAPPSKAIMRTIQLVLVLLVLFGGGVLWKSKQYQSRLAYALALWGMVVAGTIAENLLFDALYPADRTTLLIWLLWVWAIYETLVAAAAQHNPWLVRGMALVLLLGTVGNFINNANLTHCKIWHYNQSDKAAMLMVRPKVAHLTEPATLSNTWTLEPTINYYRHTLHIKYHPVDREGIQPYTDFVYGLDHPLDTNTHHLMQHFEASNTFLYIRKTSPLHQPDH